MKALFLKAKHWHLFLVFFGLPLVFNIILVTGILSSAKSFSTNPLENFNSTTSMMQEMGYFFLIIMISVYSVFFWVWSIANGLKHKLPTTVTYNFKAFNGAIIACVISFLGIAYIFLNLFQFNTLRPSNYLNHTQQFKSYITLFVPLQFVMVGLMIYCYNFAAKVIKTAHLQRIPKFSDYAEEFFLLLFNVIGVWIIQPRVHKLLNDIPLEELKPTPPTRSNRTEQLEAELDDEI